MLGRTLVFPFIFSGILRTFLKFCSVSFINAIVYRYFCISSKKFRGYQLVQFFTFQFTHFHVLLFFNQSCLIRWSTGSTQASWNWTEQSVWNAQSFTSLGFMSHTANVSFITVSNSGQEKLLLLLERTVLKPDVSSKTVMLTLAHNRRHTPLCWACILGKCNHLVVQLGANWFSLWELM